ncbi:nuclease-related domain-containing DEAD/DEAH box helicase [Roseicella aerolata]|uniref:DNA 3'-5' helicase II n=1 Tax=Roseicella aerolata TaxID=2883479 RepID=A0A9X1IBB7_9PROT|nr:nuclease-related domain-containing DEAD/DEAH box helicase [Roseicella aerolata]MCB4821252.1 NERD domain-containing protein [Roseicella aerolata]
MPHDSEAKLMTALRDQLGDDHIVLHSFPWLYPARDDMDAPAREGEADFVILNANAGILVVEAKGGEIVLRERRWRRRTGGGLKEIRDPAQQARRAMRALKKRVGLVCGEEFADSVRFATAVAFPHCVFKDQPPADLPAESIICMDDLTEIDRAVARAYAVAGRPTAKLSPESFLRLRKALAPEFSVYEPLSLHVGRDSEALAQLTSQQLQVLQGFAVNSRAVVHGVAGSGKTLLALRCARKFAMDGRRVLLTCFNAELAKWMGEKLDEEPLPGPHPITVRHFHGLASDVCRRAGIDFRPVGAPEVFWDQVVPDQMVQAATSIEGDGSLFDALVVDEAQDFSPGWWDALEYLTGLDDSVPLWAFLDRAQSLRREPTDPPIAGAIKLPLDVNCRNTRRIVHCASLASGVQSQPAPLAPLGRPVRSLSPPSQQAVAGLIQMEIRRLLQDHRLRPDQIVLIGPSSWRKGSLARVESIAGVPIVDSASEWRRGGSLLCTTARSFKGLEADVVVLYDATSLGPVFSESDLYVALTRARGHIVIVITPSSLGQSLESAATASAMLGVTP